MKSALSGLTDWILRYLKTLHLYKTSRFLSGGGGRGGRGGREGG